MNDRVRHYIKGRPDDEWYCGGCLYGFDDEHTPFSESAEEHIIRTAQEPGETLRAARLAIARATERLPEDAPSFGDAHRYYLMGWDDARHLVSDAVLSALEADRNPQETER